MKKYPIFISHSWAYGDAYDRLVDMLKSANYFEFSDHSVPKGSPIHDAPTNQELYTAIKSKMSSASVILIMAGKYATYSEWINKEIQIAKNEFLEPKKIIAIEPWGSEQTSTVVKKNADIIVGWNGQSIANAIKEIAK